MAEYIFEDRVYEFIAAGKMKYREVKKLKPAVVCKDDKGKILVVEQAEFYAKFQLKQ